MCCYYYYYYYYYYYSKQIKSYFHSHKAYSFHQQITIQSNIHSLPAFVQRQKSETWNEAFDT